VTDPVQTTQQTSDAVTATGVLGVIGVFLGAVAGLWRTVFGTKAERTDANERAAELALRAAEHADERAERADEATANHRVALGTCEEQLRAMRQQQADDRARIDRLEREHSTCGPRIAHLEAEARLSRTMLADLMRNASTPPHGIYTPDDVRAAMAATEETGP
jgi:hypothetical protein